MISFRENQRDESDNRNRNNNNRTIYSYTYSDLCFSRFRHVFVIIVVHGCV